MTTAASELHLEQKVFMDGTVAAATNAPRISPPCSPDGSPQPARRRNAGELRDGCARLVTNDGERHRLHGCSLLEPRLQLPGDLTNRSADRSHSSQGIFAFGAVGGREYHETVGKIESREIDQRVAATHRPGAPPTHGESDEGQEHHSAQPDERIIQRRPRR